MEVVFLDKCNASLPKISSLDYGECCMLEHDMLSVYMRIKTNQTHVVIKSLVPAPSRGGLMKMLNLRTGMFTCLAPMVSCIPVKVVLNVTKI